MKDVVTWIVLVDLISLSVVAGVDPVTKAAVLASVVVVLDSTAVEETGCSPSVVVGTDGSAEDLAVS